MAAGFKSFSWADAVDDSDSGIGWAARTNEPSNVAAPQAPAFSASIAAAAGLSTIKAAAPTATPRPPVPAFDAAVVTPSAGLGAHKVEPLSSAKPETRKASSWSALFKPAGAATASGAAVPSPAITAFDAVAAASASAQKKALPFGSSPQPATASLLAGVTPAGPGRAQSLRPFDPELDSSRDGIPLKLKQFGLGGGAALAAAPPALPVVIEAGGAGAVDFAAAAGMSDESRMGTKRKIAEAEEAAEDFQAVGPATPAALPVWSRVGSSTLRDKLSRAGSASSATAAAAAAATAAAVMGDEPVSVPSPVGPAPATAPAEPTAKRTKDSASSSSPLVDLGATAAAAAIAASAITAQVEAPATAAAAAAPKKGWAPRPTVAAVAAAPPVAAAPAVVPAAAPASVAASTSSAETGDEEKGGANGAAPAELSAEDIAHRIAQREKQIAIGKQSAEYQAYIAAVPIARRIRNVHPATPDAKASTSKRQFDGYVKHWRRQLHSLEYLPNGTVRVARNLAATKKGETADE